jgi:hypothetical protein
VEFAMGEDDSLHAVWQYSALLENGFPGKWIRYSGSHDGGDNWSSFLIDEADEGPGELRAGSPIIAVHDQNVYVTWVGTLDVHHEYRISIDGGLTWGPTSLFMPDLDGSAGDGLAVDGSGRLHFVGQVRYPQGLYTASFERGLWSIPSLFYLISANPSDPIGDRIHVHRVNMVVRSGNQLVTVFTDGPGEPQIRVFAMYRYLNDVPATDLKPTPVPVALSVADPPATQTAEAAAAQPAPTTAPTAVGLNREPAPASTPPSQTLVLAVFPTLLVLAGIVAFSMARKR